LACRSNDTDHAFKPTAHGAFRNDQQMKSAIEKRDRTGPGKIEVLDQPKGPNYPAGRMLIASPLAVQAVIERIPKGGVLRMSELRGQLARAFGADYTCALTTGIFLRIVAEAAEEERAQGHRNPAPYWRVIRDDGKLNPKFPGGVEAQAKKLRSEGIGIVQLRGVPRVRIQATQ
jgi:alkylated DNA nucleotide flippase Atl1